MTVSTTNTHDDDAYDCNHEYKNDPLSGDSSGIRNELWKSVTDNSGPIKDIDNLCSYSVVQMMSRNDAAKKKMLDDILNHGEFWLIIEIVWKKSQNICLVPKECIGFQFHGWMSQLSKKWMLNVVQWWCFDRVERNTWCYSRLWRYLTKHLSCTVAISRVNSQGFMTMQMRKAPKNVAPVLRGCLLFCSCIAPKFCQYLLKFWKKRAIVAGNTNLDNDYGLCLDYSLSSKLSLLEQLFCFFSFQSTV